MGALTARERRIKAPVPRRPRTKLPATSSDQNGWLPMLAKPIVSPTNIKTRLTNPHQSKRGRVQEVCWRIVNSPITKEAINNGRRKMKIQRQTRLLTKRPP